MPRLPDLLTELDLSLTELHAAKLDGLVVPIGSAFLAVDRQDDRAVRLLAIADQVPARTVVCEESAAWIWGAMPTAPSPLRVCSPPRRRARLPPSALVVAREMHLERDETIDLPVPSGTSRSITVTTALKTAVDLARAAGRPSALDALRRMLAEVGVPATEVLARLEAQPRRPGREFAVAALDHARAGAQPIG